MKFQPLCLSPLKAGIRVVCPYTLQRRWLNVAPHSSVLGLVLVPLEFSRGPFSREAENGVLLAFVESKYLVDQFWLVWVFIFFGWGRCFCFSALIHFVLQGKNKQRLSFFFLNRFNVYCCEGIGSPGIENAGGSDVYLGAGS